MLPPTPPLPDPYESGPHGLHRRLLPDVMAAGSAYPLLLGGSYALVAHGLLEPGAARRDTGLELVTEAPDAMADVVAAVCNGLQERGWQTEPLEARLVVTDAATGEHCAVGIRKETLWRPPVLGPYGPVPAAEDVVGMAVRDLADLGLARDLVDVRTASGSWSHVELEELGRRHGGTGAAAFDLTDLQARLAGAEWIADSEFAAYGLDETDRAGLLRWAEAWVDDIAERLMEEAPYEDTDEEEGEEGED
ncbi:hypothetical protein [Streptomyces hiroshimensis]|uniref:Nucleotidyl transferase AbiEii/AbiGii toxin family protein n=1 Tax=Streptomyces hiroshimensis TaxID=66424 RepID=A0ABQ2Z8D2_9ACTN|nr:hypothetical protein [Streptomyces hiroshimensis]GGY05265.1 hypothetical protein GCM10010324_60040 [Streptomyces hiroshimensis]